MKKKQPYIEDGFSLIELIAAIVIAGMAIISTFQLFSVVSTNQYKAVKVTADIEDPVGAFNLFFSYYNLLPSATLDTSNTAIIEGQDISLTEPVEITFDASLDFSIDQKISLPVTLHESRESSYYYDVFPLTRANECTFLLSGTSFIVNDTNEGSCPNSNLATTVSTLFAKERVAHFYIALSTGNLCKVVGYDAAEGWDFEWNDSCSQSDVMEALYFLPPRLVFYSNNKFSRSIIESFADPR